MSITLTDEILAKSSKQRLIEAANYRHSMFLILTEDDSNTGLKANAELESVEPYYVAPYSARATFSIDRLAQGLPMGEVVPKNRYLSRTINISRLKAATIVKKFGFGETIYLSLTSNPATTKELAPHFEEQYGLVMSEEDIIDQTIHPEASCIIMRFAPTSLGYEGAMRVDLTTPVTTVK